ncbi:tumor necrosis factor receptor superfamily member 5 isoform X1 [Monodelphis domestica]|uniref:tumor necrosis factor receptor superfamily member 5 isoform X1 n=2 Tax=Monodelphis domestica TaxID=13616 RepID=UPI0024E1C4E9|nr:tumor necrosis factor receptor superfamily member 5 isoform X1 [Monodelphis domestica]
MILFCLLWGCVFTAVHMKPSISCEEKQYLVNGLCCKKCSPGTKLVTDCTEDSETQCMPCQEGEFQSSWNHDKYCHQHKYCDPNLHLQIQKEGSLEKDTICICTGGLHCSSPECESCSIHSPCQPGFGVYQTGTGTTDTICEPCKKGFYSNVSSAFEQCLPWSSCEAPGLMKIQEGTDKTDVLCQLVYQNPVSPDRISLLVLIPITVGIVFAVITLFYWKGLCFKELKKNKVLQLVETEPQEPPGKHPQENDEDPFPVQETLLRGQPVTQEDGKESRISEQEGQ